MLFLSQKCYSDSGFAFGAPIADWASLVAQQSRICLQCKRCTEDARSTPLSGRSPGRGHGNPLQYSCLENSMDRGAWRVTVHGVAKELIDTTE